MSLRNKVLGILIGIFTAYALIAWLVLDGVLTPAFTRVEERRAVDDLERARALIALERERVEQFVMDWAYWDDTHDYVENRDPAYIERNMADDFIGELGLSFLLILGPDGERIWGEAYRSDDGSAFPIDELLPGGIGPRHRLREPTGKGNPVAGLIDSSAGPLVVASMAILRSDATGSPRGQLIAGRVLDARGLQRFSKNLRTGVELLPVDGAAADAAQRRAVDALTAGGAPHVLVTGKEVIHALTLLRDVNGAPLRVLRVATSRQVSALGDDARRASLAMLLAAGLVVLVALWLMLRSLVLQPIARLTREVRDVAHAGVRVEGGERFPVAPDTRSAPAGPPEGGDEIHRLAQAFMGMRESLQTASTRIWRLAFQDTLTGLANRRLLIDHLAGTLEATARDGRQVAVLFLDLDDFKDVNDALGHSAGDRLLEAIVGRLTPMLDFADPIEAGGAAGGGNLFARLGGDEFVVVLPGHDVESLAVATARRIIEALSAPFIVEGRSFRIGASIGIALAPADGTSVDTLLIRADMAMYRAKQRGKNVFERYAPGSVAVIERTGFRNRR